MICETCGSAHCGDYGSGRFCSQRCARQYSSNVNRDLTNQKISQTANKKRLSGVYKTNFAIRHCTGCGKQLDYRNRSGMCKQCFKPVMSINTRTKLRNIQLNKVANGTHVGWKSRNVSSYAEKFWSSVLDNLNITYSREVKCGVYFLDFVIGSIDLEIDGKQHEYHDRKCSDNKRDAYLRDQGFFVYRIKWNEINTKHGKSMMQDKISLFSAFYDAMFVNELEDFLIED